MANTPLPKARSIESVLSEFTASARPILPGQSNEEYQAGLQSLVAELTAQTPMQLYLAQKMFDCMWWLRTYETAKHFAIVHEMINILQLETTEEEHQPLIKSLRSMDWSNALLLDEVNEWGHSIESLHAQASSMAREELHNLEQLSAIRTKTLIQLQASFEALVSRPIMQERLRLQNRLMARDLGAIDLQSAISPS